MHSVPVEVVVDPYTGPAGMLVGGSRGVIHVSTGFVYSVVSKWE